MSYPKPTVNLLFNDTGAAELLEASGIHDDGWCEPVFSCRMRASQNVAKCQFGVWLKPELQRTASRLRVSVNGRPALAADVPHDILTSVCVSVPAQAGEAAQIEVTCDNSVVNKGADLRDLSFRLTLLRFT